jgi:macrolide transport system ATP-binding/permease protein
MVQVALSLVALAGAGLFIHSLRNAQQIDPGFEVQHELDMSVDLGAEKFAEPQAEAFYRDVIQRLKALPVVADASITDSPPFGGGLARTTFTENTDYTDPRNGKLTPVLAVAPGYFQTAGITLLSGRGFDEHDDANSVMVAVVGEVNTVKYATLGESPQSIVYMPLKQHYTAFVTLYVRTNGDPEKALGVVRSTVQSLIPNVPLVGVQTVGQGLVQSLTAPRIGAELLGAFGFLALILATIGTYGVMSYSVSQRTQEIGIRMSLGAQSRDVLRLILAGGLVSRNR